MTRASDGELKEAGPILPPRPKAGDFQLIPAEGIRPLPSIERCSQCNSRRPTAPRANDKFATIVHAKGLAASEYWSCHAQRK